VRHTPQQIAAVRTRTLTAVAFVGDLHRAMKWLPVLILSAGCMTPVMHFGEGKTAKQAQHDTLNEFLPARLDVEGTYRGQLRTAKIRVYADDQYRAQNLNWREQFDERLEYVNAVLGSNFGVKLVADYREWNHHEPGASLSDDLEQLHQLDPGSDVLTVVGLTSSQSLVSATFDQLGLANVPGRHMMLRGYADLEERQSFSQAFPDLPQAERENAHQARRQHKSAALLLHELAHNLGVGHEVTADTLMNASYSEHASAFSSDAHSTIQRTFDQRLGGGLAPEVAPAAAAAPAPVAAAPAAVATPAASKSKAHPTLKAIILANGSVILDGTEVGDGDLDKRFGEQAKLDIESSLVISRDKGVATTRVVKLIDRAKAAGLKNITFQ
jgi:biopolymer transport protein ExbD